MSSQTNPRAVAAQKTRRTSKIARCCVLMAAVVASSGARLLAQQTAAASAAPDAAVATDGAVVAVERGGAGEAAGGAVASETPAGEAPFEKSFVAEAGFSMESLTGGYAPWRSQYLLLISKWEPRKTAYGLLSRVERYGRRDVEALGGVYLPLGRRTTINFEGSASSHRFLPRWSAFGEISQQIGKGRFVSGGFRHSDYDGSSDVNTPQIGIEQYFGYYRAAYTLRLPQYNGRRTTGHVLQGNYYYGYDSKSNVGLNLSLGQEADLVAPGTVVIYGVRGAALSGLHYFKPDWAVSYRLGTTRQGDFYTRRGLGLGVRHDF